MSCSIAKITKSKNKNQLLTFVSRSFLDLSTQLCRLAGYFCERFTLRIGHFMFLQVNLVPRSRGWAKPTARSGQVRKFDFFDWLFQNMAVTALKFEHALRGFSGPQGNSMSVFMQIRHCARNHNICILGTFRCLQSASKVKKISSQFFIAL